MPSPVETPTITPVAPTKTPVPEKGPVPQWNPDRRLEPDKICPSQKRRVVRRLDKELP